MKNLPYGKDLEFIISRFASNHVRPFEIDFEEGRRVGIIEPFDPIPLKKHNLKGLDIKQATEYLARLEIEAHPQKLVVLEYEGESDFWIGKMPMKPFVSASQIRGFLRCRRTWYYRYVMGVEDDTQEENTKATQIGSDTHDILEHWQRSSKAAPPVKPKPDNPTAQKLADALINSGLVTTGDHVIGIEQSLEPALFFDGTQIAITGFIDLVERRDDGGILITDYKTTADLKWALSEERLFDDMQAIIYSHWASLYYDKVKRGDVDFRLLYVEKKRAKTREVKATLGFKHINAKMVELSKIVHQMVEYSYKTIEEVAPTRDACSAFGGCEHIYACHRTPFKGKTFFKETEVGAALRKLYTTTPTKEKEMSKSSRLKDLLEKKRKAKETDDPNKIDPNKKADDLSDIAIIPPDAPEDLQASSFSEKPFSATGLSKAIVQGLKSVGIETMAELEAYLVPGFKKIPGFSKGGLDKVNALRAAYSLDPLSFPGKASPKAKVDPNKVKEEVKEDPNKAKAKEGLTRLFIDCIPMNNPSRPLSTFLEHVLKTENVGEEYYGSPSFREGERVLAGLCIKYIDVFLKDSWTVSSASNSSKELLEILEPHCDLIVRGLK